MKLLTYNIAFGAGLTNLEDCIHSSEELKQNLSRIRCILEECQADIVAIQEIDRHSRRSGFVDQVQELGAAYPYHCFVTTWKKAWVPYPFTWKVWQHFGKIWAGQALFSRYPLTPISTLVFEKPKRLFFPYNWFYLDRVAQLVAVQVPNRSSPIHIVHLHLEAFHAPTRQRQIQALIQWLSHLPTPDILMGDFNAELEELGPLLERYSLQDSLILSHVPPDQRATYPCDHPVDCLDHCLVSPSLQLGISSRVWISPPPFGSDHFPILTSIKEQS